VRFGFGEFFFKIFPDLYLPLSFFHVFHVSLLYIHPKTDIRKKACGSLAFVGQLPQEITQINFNCQVESLGLRSVRIGFHDTKLETFGNEFVVGKA